VLVNGIAVIPFVEQQPSRLLETSKFRGSAALTAAADEFFRSRGTAATATRRETGRASQAFSRDSVAALNERIALPRDRWRSTRLMWKNGGRFKRWKVSAEWRVSTTERGSNR